VAADAAVYDESNIIISIFASSMITRVIVRAALLLGAVYLALLGALYFGQEKLLFAPTPLPADYVFAKPGVAEVSVAVHGATLHGLHYTHPGAKGLVFYLHGNAGNVDTWLTNTDFYQRAGFDVFMLDYRGYGKSSGRIQSEAQLHADVRAAYDQVAARYAGKRIVVLGRSLGTALAAKLAADVQPALTVLVSPYSSMVRMAREQYPFVPATLLRYPLDTQAYLARVTTPVLMLHGQADTLIPVQHAERLAKIGQNIRLIRVAQAGHNDIHQHADYLEPLADALKRL
jgi:uncharacterized protein